MRDRILSVLHQINENISTLSTEQAGLMSGDAGIRLFSYEYAKFFNLSPDAHTQASLLEGLVSSSYELESPTFCGGKAGVNWFFNYLSNDHIISKEDLAFICDDDEALAREALEMTGRKNYDYLHGGTGVFYALLCTETFEKETYFHQFFHLLTSLVEESPGKNILPYFSMENYRLKRSEVNLSLSHGITSVLKFCMECIKKKVCPEPANRLAQMIADYLYINHGDGSFGSYYTSIVDGNSNFSPSRLAWCYGDLTIGYMLLQYGLLTDDVKIKKLAIKVLTHTTHRTNDRNEIIIDAGICHGTAGVTHVYHKLCTLYNLTEFENVRDYWLSQTLKKIEQTDWQAGYRKYNGYFKTYSEDHTLLEGSAGIGLVLLSYLSADFNWDYLLMLN